MSKVYQRECFDYEEESLSRYVTQIFMDWQGIPFPAKSKKNIFLKVNLLMRAAPEKAITTHPKVVEAVAAFLMGQGYQVTIGDCPGGPFNSYLLEKIYRETGMNEVAEKTGCLLNHDFAIEEIDYSQGMVVKKIKIAKAIHDADYIINIAKLKTHGMMVFSGAVKNMFGIVPGLLKAEFHYRMPDVEQFSYLLMDICNCSAPIFSFIDGIVGMEGDGPSAGEPKKLGLLFAGEDPYKVDQAAVVAIGLKEKYVPILKYGIKVGLVQKADNKVETKVAFSIPMKKDIHFLGGNNSFLGRRINKALTPSPVIIEGLCVKCGVCYQHCPAKTILWEDKESFPKIILDACVRCFCCQEMCPMQAIKIKRSLLNKLVTGSLGSFDKRRNK